MFWLSLYTDSSRIRTEKLQFEPPWSATLLKISKQLFGGDLYASLSSTVNNTQCYVTHTTDKMSVNKPVQKHADHFWPTAFFPIVPIRKVKETGV